MHDRSRKGRAPTGDKHGHRTHPGLAKGQRNGRAKLTDDDVRAIRRIFASGGITRRDLAKQFGVSNVVIGNILSGKSWSHVQ
ncbi:hypothetical protein [Nitrolancea hollandica]|nr:hypothetical protein [Nitrolancea hollandica]